MQLRPIQQKALDEIVESFRGGGTYHLVQAPVAFGKTILSSGLINHSFSKYGAKCLFLAHLQELVTQTIDKMLKVAPDLSLGVYMGNRKEMADIVVGTRQTVERNLEDFGSVNLVICDECHLWGPQYQKIIDYLKSKNPRLRVLGVTGTPYNSKGWIYGEGKIWPEPCFTTTIDQMIALGYLSRFRYKLAEEPDLSGVKMVAGEFHEGQLSNLMREDRHMGSVSEAIKDHCEDRERVMVFAVTIEHAEALAESLGCKAVHSKLKKDEWRRRVDEFKEGRARILVNVGQLTVGFDCPEVDALIVARPTNSTALHVQICGRGLRVSPAKSDALIVDLCGNYIRNGLPNRPRVYDKKKREEGTGEAEARAQICPECLEVVEGPDLECPFCGAEMKEKKEFNELNERMRMRELEVEARKPKVIAWGERKHVTKIGSTGVMFWLIVSNRDKSLMRFCGAGTRKEERTRRQLKGLKKGEAVEIAQTGFGPWIA